MTNTSTNPSEEEDTLSTLKSTTTKTSPPSSTTTTTKGKQARIKREMSLNGGSDAPVEVTFEDISAAAFRIKSGVRKTPCEVSSHSYIHAIFHAFSIRNI